MGMEELDVLAVAATHESLLTLSASPRDGEGEPSKGAGSSCNVAKRSVRPSTSLRMRKIGSGIYDEAKSHNEALQQEDQFSSPFFPARTMRISRSRSSAFAAARSALSSRGPNAVLPPIMPRCLARAFKAASLS